MGIPRPKGIAHRFFCNESLYDIVIAVAATIPGGIAAWSYMGQGKTGMGAFFIGAVAVSGSAAIMKAAFRIRREQSRESTHELAGCLQTLHAILGASDPSNARLRITIHVPIKANQRLLQVMDYVGDEPERPTRGRTFPAQSGVIGRALRTKRMVVARRVNMDPTKYREELITEHSYTPEDAAEIQAETMAWMAVPILADEKHESIEGILFLDTTDPDFFTEDRTRTVELATIGIARFIRARYSNR